ncbi:Oxidoreductase [Emericellopsis cladophorae]|uniref:Oxidoreductase n=1 Tax=Emericellopsis cladophorae TaxID=2686198 RepID=A0A9Q0BBJ0_9HYPO|nr:Oxidoreductase [Emericellopsis cladophorae]KAI6778114.1 Oxidoreductase [Emericellopsis cladophorae]
MSRILVVGATRGLGASLVKHYTSSSSTTVYATARSSSGHPQDYPDNAKRLTGVDLTKRDVGDTIVKQLPNGGKALDVAIIAAGYFATEDFKDGPDWDEQQLMYTTCAIAPVFIVQRLVKAGLLASGSKVLLVSSEAGSIALRHESEGGGNYGHHASKAALNMAGKLLSLDLKEQGIVVSLVHPGFMRTDMTRNVGFDKYWDAGGAISPDEAAQRLGQWVEELDMSKTGEFWAPGGAGDIGTAEAVLGSDLPKPLRLPW